jgi:hypothetical protein
LTRAVCTRWAGRGRGNRICRGSIPVKLPAEMLAAEIAWRWARAGRAEPPAPRSEPTITSRRARNPAPTSKPRRGDAQTAVRKSATARRMVVPPAAIAPRGLPGVESSSSAVGLSTTPWRFAESSPQKSAALLAANSAGPARSTGGSVVGPNGTSSSRGPSHSRGKRTTLSAGSRFPLASRSSVSKCRPDPR